MRRAMAMTRAVAWRMAVAVAVFVTPAAERAPQLRQPGAVRELAPGKILVAARNLPDPNFSQTVVLLADYNAEGAMGLVINRRTDVPIARGFQHLRLAQERAVFYEGGPVAPTGVIGLWRSEKGQDSRTVIPGVEMVGEREPLEKLLVTEARDDRFRVFVGYAGWGPGQLERETSYGSWHVFTVAADVVFDPDPETLWSRQLQRTELRQAVANPRHRRGPVLVTGNP